VYRSIDFCCCTCPKLAKATYDVDHGKELFDGESYPVAVVDCD
jgi:hypothetical protein